MIDAAMVASKAAVNPGEVCAALKVLYHQSLAKGRDFLIAGDNEKANNCFAFAYQTRCVCDWIWKNLMGKSGDLGHAKYLQIQRSYSQYALGKITKAEVLEKI